MTPSPTRWPTSASPRKSGKSSRTSRSISTKSRRECLGAISTICNGALESLPRRDWADWLSRCKMLVCQVASSGNDTAGIWRRRPLWIPESQGGGGGGGPVTPADLLLVRQAIRDGWGGPQGVRGAVARDVTALLDDRPRVRQCSMRRRGLFWRWSGTISGCSAPTCPGAREPMPVTTDLRDATLTDLLPFSDIRCNQTKWIAISIVGRRMFADIGEKAKKPLFASLIHTAEVTGSSPVSPTSESVISVLPLVNSVHRCTETATTRRHSYSRPSASRTDV